MIRASFTRKETLFDFHLNRLRRGSMQFIVSFRGIVLLKENFKDIELNKI